MMRTELTVDQMEAVVGGDQELELLHNGDTGLKPRYDLRDGLPFHIEAGIVISAYWKKLWD